ncbi:MAG: hypothetical protein AAFR65_05090 [Pseudomonadota bacterium]
MALEILAPTVEPSQNTIRTNQAVDPQRQAAEQLQVAFFTDMLIHGGFADAFSTGSNTLDSFTSLLVESVAKEIAAKDPSLADHFYSQLKGQKSGPSD